MAENTGKTMGQIINQLIENNLQNFDSVRLARIRARGCSSSLFFVCLDSLFQVVFLKQSLRRIQAASNNVPKSHGAS